MVGSTVMRALCNKGCEKILRLIEGILTLALGFKPEILLDAGIEKVIAEYRSQKSEKTT